MVFNYEQAITIYRLSLIISLGKAFSGQSGPDFILLKKTYPKVADERA